MRRGNFLVIEGCNGAGKTTVARHLRDLILEHTSCDVYLYHDPGGTSVGMKLRALLKTPDLVMSPMTQFLLYTAARAELGVLCAEDIEHGFDVIMDRWWPSTYAYQGLQGIDDLDIINLTQKVTPPVIHTQPGLTFFLDVLPETAMQRSGAAREPADVEAGGDRFERKGIEFASALRERYLQLVGSGMLQRVAVNDSLPRVVATKIWDRYLEKRYKKEGKLRHV